jgi:nitrite reductase/ring-hydroxylating ferredoxin subunit
MLTDLTGEKGDATMERFIVVANVKEIDPGRAKLIYFGYQSIAIFNVGGAFYATDEFCTAMVVHSLRVHS